jgi:hypothetical protein
VAAPEFGPWHAVKAGRQCAAAERWCRGVGHRGHRHGWW